MYDYKENPNVKKSVLLRLMTFVYDLSKGIKSSSEDYEKWIEGLDIKQMEANFAKKMQEVLQRVDQK